MFVVMHVYLVFLLQGIAYNVRTLQIEWLYQIVHAKQDIIILVLIQLALFVILIARLVQQPQTSVHHVQMLTESMLRHANVETLILKFRVM